jgi:hypothetical protein
MSPPVQRTPLPPRIQRVGRGGLWGERATWNLVREGIVILQTEGGGQSGHAACCGVRSPARPLPVATDILKHSLVLDRADGEGPRELDCLPACKSAPSPSPLHHLNSL